MSIKFIPNDFARAKFNLVATEYYGDGVTSVLTDALGPENYKRYVIPQNPFSGGATSATVDIRLDPADQIGRSKSFGSIGRLYDLY